MALLTDVQLSTMLRDLTAPCAMVNDCLWHWANANQRGVKGWCYDTRPAPAYTSSLDAALSLLPVVGNVGALDEKPDYILWYVNGGLTVQAAVAPNSEDSVSFGQNAAIAMCRAIVDAAKYHTQED